MSARQPENNDTKRKKGVSRRQLLTGWRDSWKESWAEDEKDHEAREQAASKAAAEAGRALAAGLAEARQARAQGQFQQAVDLLRPLVKQYPRHDELRRELGLCLYGLGQFIQARVEFERLLRSPEPDNIAALHLGLCHLHLDKPERTVTAWQRFTPLSPAQEPLAGLLREQCAELAEAEDGTQPPCRKALDVVGRAAAILAEA